ncbi:MAG: hypothetical protein ABSD58_09645 [Verrucomicrobiia bacterium]|jgi:hypothetical protein
MTPTEAKRLKKKAYDRYMREIHAIDTVLELSQRNEAGKRLDADVIISLNGGNSDQPERQFGHSNPEFEDKIFRIIAEKLSGDFKMADVMQVVGEAAPEFTGRRSTVSFAVSGLVAAQKLTVVQQGRGRRPGIYRVALEPATKEEASMSAT